MRSALLPQPIISIASAERVAETATWAETAIVCVWDCVCVCGAEANKAGGLHEDNIYTYTQKLESTQTHTQNETTTPSPKKAAAEFLMLVFRTAFRDC